MRFYYIETLEESCVVDFLMSHIDNVLSLCVTRLIEKNKDRGLRCDFLLYSDFLKGQQQFTVKMHSEKNTATFDRLKTSISLLTFENLNSACDMINKGFKETPLKMFFDE